MSEKTGNPQQIAVCKTNKVLVEALARLRLPDLTKNEPYAALHGKYSRICLRMCNYANKENSTTMDFNIESYLPAYFLAIFPSVLTQTQFDYKSDKMLSHKKNEDGTVLVTKLSITRSRLDGKGEVRRNPWFIKIENGSGTPKDGANGTSYFTNYSMKTSAVIALSDDAFYMLMYKTSSYIHAWEMANCPKMIKSEIARIEAEYFAKRDAA